MKKYIPIALFYASNLAVTTPAISQDTTEAKEEKPKVILSGYMDTYILHAFNNPLSGTLMGNPAVYGGAPAGRAFDRLTDQFSLGLVQTKFTYSDKKSEMVIDLTFGPNAELGNFGNTRSTTLWTSPNTFESQMIGTSASIKQAYFTYKATDKLSFTVGQFGTHIGYEVIDAPINYHYSLSNLFNNGPFYHIGMKANYMLTDHITLMAGLVNNWDNLFANNSQKTVVSQVYVNPVKRFNIYINYIGGYGNDTYLSTVATSTGHAYLNDYTRQLFDLVTGYQVTTQFYVGLNAAYGFYHFKAIGADEKSIIGQYGSTKPAWGGVALYTNYAMNDVVGIGVRYEYFNDENHVRYIGIINRSLTITAPITLADGHLIVKPEFRMDAASNTKAGELKYYEDKNGNGTNGQQTFGAAFIYKY
ncbi:MAG: porin [Bacteroidetes bacterium]|nr:porin [Bacteroidota bacterium]MBS1540836.1 porin [Bacteroidota bacterium]